MLEDMLVSVLMLLVSVTTMAEGKREVWEYWGGSCLCAYTVDRRGTGQGKATPALQGWEGTAGDRDEVKRAKGRTQCFPPSHCIVRQQKPLGNEGLWLDQSRAGEGRDEAECDHPAPELEPPERGAAWAGQSRRRAQADFPPEFISLTV